MRRFPGAIVAVLAVSAACAQAQTPQRLAGDVVRFDAGLLEIRTAAGAHEKAAVNDRTRISLRSAGDVAHIQSGSYVGVTAAPRADGTLVASEVQIFPEAMRGTGEGHRPMTGSNTMTNATVASVSGRPASRGTETNATVSSVGASESDIKLDVTYKGGEKLIVVPRTAIVFITDAGNASALVPGAHVIVYASSQADGGLVAERISVGKGSYVPLR